MEVNNKKYFYFPKFRLKHFLFLAYFLFICAKRGIQIVFKIEKSIPMEFIKLFIYDFGDFLSIIPLIIMKKRMKSKNESNLNGNNEDDIANSYVNKMKKKAKSALYKNIFLFTLIDFIAQIAPVIFFIITSERKLVVTRANLNSTLIFNIFVVIICSYFLLHAKIFKHHKFSILLDILCLIILAIIDFIKIFEIKETILISLIYISIRILSGILYSIDDVVAKIIFLHNFYPTYALLVSKSIIDFFYLIVFSFPFIFIKLEDSNGEQKNVFSMISDVFDDKNYFLIFIIYIITSFVYNNLYLKIIDDFSPNHLIIAKLSEDLGIFIINLIVNGVDSEENVVIRFIMFILLILSSIIYNEYLVINICGLSKNTQLFLDFKETNDFLTIISEDMDNDIIELNNYTEEDRV